MNGMFADGTKLIPAIVRGILAGLGTLLVCVVLLAVLLPNTRPGAGMFSAMILASAIVGVLAAVSITLPRKRKRS